MEPSRGIIVLGAQLGGTSVVIAEMQKEGRPWVWKDPAPTFFVPLRRRIWGRVAYVITVRHPTDTALPARRGTTDGQ